MLLLAVAIFEQGGFFCMRRILLFVFLLSAGFFNSCGDSTRGEDTRRPDGREPLEKMDREEVIRRLTSRNNSPVISTTIDDRYRGVTIYEDYKRDYKDDPPCDEYEECKDICVRLVSSTRRRRCYDEPHSLIEALNQGVFDLLDISGPDKFASVAPGLLQAMFEIDQNIISNLIRRDRMTEGDLRIFLAWIALNRDIASVLNHEDRSRHILQDAFKNLGEFQVNKTHGSLKAGFNTGLLGNEDTFLSLAADRDNEEAFIMGNSVIEKDLCSTKQCKLEIYCARDSGSRRSRFERIKTSTTCQTPGKVRRYRRGGICYVHGSITWSYLDDLIEDEEIRSSDLSGFIIGVDKCNEICGDKDSALCDAI